jgi:hypothetical protein
MKHKKCPAFRASCTCLARAGTRFFVCCGYQCTSCGGWLTAQQSCRHAIRHNGICRSCGNDGNER